jgi:Zn-dependent peptidase ImmA (M78 family)
MPRDDVLARIPRVRWLDDLVVAKKRWGVSVSALAYRLHKLGVLTDWDYRTLCIQINTNGYRTSEPQGMQKERSVVWQKVFGQLWNERITREHIASELRIPAGEIDDLVFGLTETTEAPVGSKPELRVVAN